MNIIRLELRKVDKQEDDKYADLSLYDDETYELLAKAYENCSFKMVS
jgi:hypothetical protein